MGGGISSGYSGMEGKPNTQSKIEAKYPALLFKQHLTACVERIYGLIRDSLKKDISPFLNLCIQVCILLEFYPHSTSFIKFLVKTLKAIYRHLDLQGSDL